MARRGGAAAAETTGSALADEVESLGPSESRFSDPVRAERPESDEPAPPPPPSPTPTPEPDSSGIGVGTTAAPTAAPEFDARAEIERLTQHINLQAQRSAMLERELQFRALAAAQQAQAQQPVQQIDPVLQEVIDILQVSEDDLIEVFQGGAKGAQVVTRALQATALLAIQAAEKRLVRVYQHDQAARQQAQVIDQRAGQMHQAFWAAYPELADHEIVVQHYAAQVAAEQAQAPRFDWESAQHEVARRTVQHLRQAYNVNIQPAATPQGYAAPRPTLQSRLRPAFAEMGGGRARGGSADAQTQLTAEILDLGR